MHNMIPQTQASNLYRAQIMLELHAKAQSKTNKQLYISVIVYSKLRFETFNFINNI